MQIVSWGAKTTSYYNDGELEISIKIASDDGEYDSNFIAMADLQNLAEYLQTVIDSAVEKYAQDGQEVE